MTTIGSPPRPSGEWDVPATQVAAEFVALKAKRTTTGLLAEQRHQLLDLDPDSAFTLPGCTCVNCPPKITGGTA
ncbi:hypothetical protein ACFWDI_19005 [Streptomyces sp. NPDC060064]|uniref:hypothetical protein n=1 Tax=Streptomyces sp. NPDC060064 TaxID=3347049 RepID=UPI0036861D4B